MRPTGRKSQNGGKGTLPIFLVVVGLLLWALLTAQDKTKAVQLVKAAQGGQVRSPSGKAVLSIPAGALSADTKITISELPGPEGPNIGPVYDLQPDGLKFQKPASFTVSYSPRDVPQDFEVDDVVLVNLLPPTQSAAGPGQQGPAEQPMVGWDFLETGVDPSAGAASAQLTHLSKYGLRACASWRIGEEAKNEIRGKFDFGMKFSQAEGAGSARANYFLPGELLGQAGVPIGTQGMAVAHSDLSKWFRVKRGKDGQRSVSKATISVSFRGKATLSRGTNEYIISIAVQCYDQKAVAVGRPYIENLQFSASQGRLVMPGLFQQNFFDDPIFGGKMTAFPMGPRQENIFPIVRFKNCQLEAGKYYGLTVGATISVSGFERDDTAGIPPRGGQVGWEVPLGFFITRISVSSQ